MVIFHFVCLPGRVYINIHMWYMGMDHEVCIPRIRGVEITGGYPKRNPNHQVDIIQRILLLDRSSHAGKTPELDWADWGNLFGGLHPGVLVPFSGWCDFRKWLEYYEWVIIAGLVGGLRCV
jgi:hypothetical protein